MQVPDGSSKHACAQPLCDVTRMPLDALHVEHILELVLPLLIAHTPSVWAFQPSSALCFGFLTHAPNDARLPRDRLKSVSPEQFVKLVISGWAKGHVEQLY